MAYAGADLVVDFISSEYRLNGTSYPDFLSIPNASYSRSGNATAENAAGLVISFGANVPRITNRGVLMEEARTNVVLRNRDLTQSVWTKTNVTASRNQTGADGVANSATSLTATAANGTCLQAITLASSQRFHSCYIKRLSGSGNIQMTMDNGATWTTVPVTASWTRVSVASQTIANPTVGFRIVTSGNSIAVDYVQNENGAFATSAIETTTAAVTRPKDVAKITGLTAPSSWTMFSDFDAAGRAGETLIANLLNSAENDNETVVSYVKANLTRSHFARVGAVVQLSVSPTSSGERQVTGWDGTTYRYTTNGGAVGTGGAVALAWDRLGIGCRGSTDTVGTAFTRRIVIYPSWVGDSTAQAMSQNFLSVDAGGFAFSGQAAALARGALIGAASGACSIAGQAANLVHGTLVRYVSAAGSDSNDGLTASTPWATTGHLNTQPLASGAIVYLRGGDTFGYLELSDRAGVKFTSYGTGRATIDGGAGIAAYGQDDLSGLEIDGINFVGSGKDTNTSLGIMLWNGDGGAARKVGVSLRNMDISGFGGTGLLIGSDPPDGSAAGFDGLTIDGVNVAHCDETGIQVYGRSAPAIAGAHTGLTITNCTVDDCDFHGIIVNDVDGGLLEGNVVTGCGADFTGGTAAFMAYDANDVVLRGNEAADQITPNAGGGNGINLDQNCTNCVAEYNFIHLCQGAGIELYGAATGTWQDNTVRYNIVIDCGWNVAFNGALTIETTGQQLAGVRVYNNVFRMPYAGRGAVRVVTDKCDGFVANNILMVSGGAAHIKAQTLAEGSLTPADLWFAGNDYYLAGGARSILWGGANFSTVAAWQGFDPTQEKIGGVDVYSAADPRFVDQNGAVAADYRLGPGSPMFDLGLDVEAVFGVVSDGGRDYFGRSIPNFAGFNIGADAAATPKVDAVPGAYALAGQAVSLFAGRAAAAAAGTFACAGQLAGTPYSRLVPAAAASFGLSGQAAGLLKGGAFAVSGGGVALAGQDASLVYTPVGGFALAGEAGGLTCAVQGAGLHRGYPLVSESGGIALIGQAANVPVGRSAPAAFGQFAFAGQDVSFLFGQVFQVQAGTLGLEGRDAALNRGAATSFGLSARLAAFLLSGGVASLRGPVWTPIAPASSDWTVAPGTSATWALVGAHPQDWTPQ